MKKYYRGILHVFELFVHKQSVVKSTLTIVPCCSVKQKQATNGKLGVCPT